MADALKRMYVAQTAGFQDRCCWYMYQKAADVFNEDTPDPDDLLLAKSVWAGQVKKIDMAMVVLTNTTIGPAVDNGTPIDEDWIEFAIKTEGQFHNLALSYKAAGLIGA